MVRSFARRAPAGGALWLLVGAVGGLSGPALACTGEPVSVAWLADHAAQVVVCDVTDVRSHWADGHTRIESEVTLAPVQFLKGRPADERAALSITFPGGTVGQTTMRLCCTPDLEAGQRWLIFLQPEFHTYPAPGMGQGLFEIRMDEAQTAHVFAPGGRPVVGVDEQGVPVVSSPAPAARNAPQPVAVVGNLRVRAIHTQERSASPAPMTLEAFEAAIRPAVEASRAYDVTQPAGRYVPTAMTPVPLGVVPGGASPQRGTARPTHVEQVPEEELPAHAAPINPDHGDSDQAQPSEETNR